MKIRPHHSQHEQAEALPLVTCDATVSRVDVQDRDRRDEIPGAVRDVLADHGKDEWLGAVAGADVDWDALWERLSRSGHAGRLERRLRTLHERYERAHPSLVAVEFEPERPFEFVAGEYVSVYYRHVPRPYSISSSPTADTLEICVRRVPGGRLSTLLCEEVAVGDSVVVRGPFGSEFVLQEPSTRDVAFLATGTGVAPLKSMIEYVFEEGSDRVDGVTRDIWLFLGSSWEDDLPYRDRFAALAAERDNFHFVPTCTREASLTDWDGEQDYVQHTMLKYVDDASVDLDSLNPDLRQYVADDPALDVDARLDPSNLDVYACGLNAMAYALVAAARSVGVPDQRIRSEGYG